MTLSKASSKKGPLYQGMLEDLSIMLSPAHPEIGTKGIFSGLYPTFFKKVDNSALISLYLYSE